jgi:hypothetical protein
VTGAAASGVRRMRRLAVAVAAVALLAGTAACNGGDTAEEKAAAATSEPPPTMAPPCERRPLDAPTPTVTRYVPAQVAGVALQPGGRLAEQLAGGSACIRQLSSAEVPRTGPGAGSGIPRAFVAAVLSEQDVAGLKQSLSQQGNSQFDASSETVAGAKVDRIDIDLAKLAGPQATAPNVPGAELPKITALFWAPSDDTLVMVWSFDGEALARDVMQASVTGAG